MELEWEERLPLRVAGRRPMLWAERRLMELWRGWGQRHHTELDLQHLMEQEQRLLMRPVVMEERHQRHMLPPRTEHVKGLLKRILMLQLGVVPGKGIKDDELIKRESVVMSEVNIVSWL